MNAPSRTSDSAYWQHVRKVVDSAPPATSDQLARVGAVLKAVVPVEAA